MDFTDILYEKSDRIATITYNRPEKMNAWTTRMFEELRAATTDADGDPDVGAIIITGAGRAYCAGADMAGLSRLAQGTDRLSGTTRAAPGTEDLDPNYQGRFSYLLALKKPVIAAINGAAAGMGFANALYADVRIASDRARMGLIFVRRGLAIEFGSSWMLPRLIGIANAIDLAVTGRLVDASEALRMGLVNKVVAHDELIPIARAFASEIATQCSPLGVAQAKRAVYRHLFTDLATALKEEDELAAMMTKSEDFKEGIKSFMEKRAPRFPGR
jgi:enoyl-CoA hydratase/carnithine racemase